jgi:murein L,D-transpeptidase YafK
MKGDNTNHLNKNYTNRLYGKLTAWLLFLFVISSFTMNNLTGHSFKNEQKKFERVKQAYLEKEKDLQALFREKGLNWNNFSLLLTGFKTEKLLKVYIRSGKGKRYELLKTYDFCVLSGKAGPKRKEGDGQVPEGLYEITRFNPQSNFHISLRINYPNASDRVLSDKAHPGSDIYIHGNCVSVGCIPLTDDLIQELYILCVETWDRGDKIPVYLFPFEMSDSNYTLFKGMDWGPGVENLWSDLKPVYDEFIQKQDIIDFTIDKKGRYNLQ